MRKEMTIHFRSAYELIKKGVSDDAIAIYISLLSLYNINMEEMTLSCNSLYRQLYNKPITNGNKNREYKWIKSALEELDNYKIIEILEEEDKEFTIDMSNLKASTNITIEQETINPFTGESNGTEKVNVNNFYITLQLEQIQNVLKDNGNKKSILKYMIQYFNLKANNKDLYYFNMERSQIGYECELDIRTIDRYNNILTNNEIIYIYKYDYKYSDSQKTISNAYGLNKDKDKIESECEKFIKEKIANGEIYESKTYANKGKNTKEFKQSLVKKEVENEEPKVSKSFGDRKPKIDVEPTEQQLQKIKKNPVEVKDITNKEVEKIEKIESAPKKNIYDWKASLIKDGYIPKEQPKRVVEEIDISQLI